MKKRNNTILQRNHHSHYWLSVIVAFESILKLAAVTCNGITIVSSINNANGFDFAESDIGWGYHCNIDTQIECSSVVFFFVL